VNGWTPRAFLHLDPISEYQMANPIHVNPSFAARRLTIGGSDWLWVVTTIMCISALMVFAWSKMVSVSLVSDLARFSPVYRKQARGTRAFHNIAVVILTVSSITYFAMASNLGQTLVRTEFRNRPGPTRSIFVCFFHSSFPLFHFLIYEHSGCGIYSGSSMRRSFSSCYC
jgi:bacteriorhodopsin